MIDKIYLFFIPPASAKCRQTCYFLSLYLGALPWVVRFRDYLTEKKMSGKPFCSRLLTPVFKICSHDGRMEE